MSNTNNNHFTSPIDLDANGQALLKQVLAFYAKSLEQSEDAINYLSSKGIGNELILKHRLGYADRTLGMFLPISTIKAGAVIRRRLQKVGLVRSTGHEHFNGAVILPIFSSAGDVVQIYGRRFARGLSRGTERYPRLNTQVFDLFPGEAAFAKVFLKDGESLPSFGAGAPVAPVAVSFSESFASGSQELKGGYERSECADSAERKSDLSLTQSGDDYHLRFDKRDYRIRGLHKNNSLEVLRINLRLFIDDKFFLDELNLYSAKQRMTYIKQASDETGLENTTVKSDLGKILFQLEEIQQKRIDNELEKVEQKPSMTADEEQAALDLLKDPNLLDRILADFDACGIVGEATNKLTGYLAAVSRHLAKPLAVLIQSTSAAGKSTLMEAVLSFIPAEEKVKYSAMTGQSLYYLGSSNLKHKVLAIAEEEGAARASYALKLLQSEGELNIASTGKDATSGKLTTEEYHVEGPVMLFFTTTSSDVDEELLNRCLILTVDEGRDQTLAIHKLQRESRTTEGVERSEKRSRILSLHHNAQRLLRPLKVLNPYAARLTFRSDCTRTRRDHEKYLSLIDSIALFKQHQRKLIDHNGTTCVEVELEDIEEANRLAHEVLGRSLDELAPQTRNLLRIVQEMAKADCEKQELDQIDYRFTQRQLREHSGWGSTQIKVHLAKLKELEYVCASRRKQTDPLLYELLYDGDINNGRHLMGLIDVDWLKRGSSRSQCSHSDVGMKSVSGQNPQITKKPEETSSNSTSSEESLEKRTKEGESNG